MHVCKVDLIAHFPTSSAFTPFCECQQTEVLDRRGALFPVVDNPDK